MADRATFLVTLDQVAPPDPAFALALPSQKKALMSAVVGWVLTLKDAELAAGLDREGKPLKPLSPVTIAHRHSAMGPANPHAPPLTPAEGLSRTRALLTGKAGSAAAEFYWKYDPHTRASWGDVLELHAEGAGKLPVRDVIGVSQSILSQCRTLARAWWRKFKATGVIPKNVVPPPPPAVAAAVVPTPPKYFVQSIPKYQPANPENAVPKAPKQVSQIKINGNVYTLGAGIGGKPSAAGIMQGIANGSFSGFHAIDLSQGPPPMTPPTVAPTPPKPPPKSPLIKKPPPPPKVYPAVSLPDAAPKTDRLSHQQIATLYGVKAKKAKAPPPPPFPASPDGLDVIRRLGGSTGAQQVKDPATGKSYVYKKGNNPGHLREESYADSAYRALGIPVVPSRLYETPSGPVKLSEFKAGKTLADLLRDDPDAAAAAVEKLKKGFVADALLGNWDVVGMDFDNILVVKGVPYRIDNGGALRYRAQGALKSSSSFGPEITELDSLRDATVNRSSAKVFGSITDAEIKAQAKAIVKKKAALLAALPSEIRPAMEARLAYLEKIATAKPSKIKPYVPKVDPTTVKKFGYNYTEMDDWGNRHYKRWAESLTTAQNNAVYSYTASGYRAMNEALRTESGREAAWKEPLQQSLLAAKLPEPIQVTRGIDDAEVTGWKVSEFKPGALFYDKGFNSTSLKEKPPLGGDVHFIINIPKGAPGAYVNANSRYSAHPDEREFLLPYGSRFRVIKFEGTRYHARIYVEFIGVGPEFGGKGD